MLVEECVGDRYEMVVPPVPLGAFAIRSLVASEQQDRRTAWIECEQHAQRASVRYPKFLHVRVPALADLVNRRPAKCWASFLEEPNSGGEGFLLVFGEFVPLCDELVCDLDCPRHTVILNIRIC